MNRVLPFYALSLAGVMAACMPVPVAETETVIAEPVVITEAEAPIAPSARGAYAGAPRRGVLTAGDIDDALNLGSFSRYAKRMSGNLGLPQLGLGLPVQLQLFGPNGAPAPGAYYTLRRPGAAEPFHTAYSGPDGRIFDFPQVLGAGALGAVEIRVFGGEGEELARKVVKIGKPQRLDLTESAQWKPDFLDLVLVVDTTGSMGDEIAFLQKELIGIVRAASAQAPEASIRFGLIAYRDHGDDYVVRDFGFTNRPGQMNGWLRRLSADGGGDYPEAAAAALRAGVNMPWRKGKGERIVIHIADAPPHDGDAAAYLRAAKAAAQAGVQVFTLGASGVAEEAELLMRQASVATGGRYLFLTDDSGVGYSHAEPTVACYRVTSLQSLLVRVLGTELSGRRQEAGDVIREVGSYRNGVCRD